MTPRAVICRLALLGLMGSQMGSLAFAENQVGDTVVVIHDTPMKLGNKVVQELPRGVGLRVQAINGDWLWVSYHVTGWINARDVATPTRAVEAFTEQIRRDPHDARAYVCRGLAWFDKDEFDIAIADLNEAIRLNPTDASAYSSRSICWWAKREVDKALADSSEAIRLDPGNATYLANRGILWNMKGDYARALADAEAAARGAPKLVTSYLVRGKALTRMHEPAKAVAALAEALKINPYSATAYGMRGRAQANRGAYAEAMRDFEKSLELDPKNPSACGEIARFYATCPEAEFRDARKAIKYAERACELSHWRTASLIGVLAAAHAEAGDFEKAADFQERAAGMVPVRRQADYKARLRLYLAHKPYRETPQVRSGREDDGGSDGD